MTQTWTWTLKVYRETWIDILNNNKHVYSMHFIAVVISQYLHSTGIRLQ